MEATARQELLRKLGERFGSRCKPAAGRAGALATVSPVNAGEAEYLARTARQYSVKLSPAGAGVDPDLPEPAGDIVLVSTGMMRTIRFPDDERGAVEVEPGVLWVDLEDELRASHRALTVYPSSAPRSTVGGWIARDGLGLGSFAHGWLKENVLCARVITPAGEPRTLTGEDLDLAVGAMGKSGLIVHATLKLRQTRGDRPFAATFTAAEALQNAIGSLLERRPPLWHLGFMNPPMARAMHSQERYLIFGAYPASGAAPAENELLKALGQNRGRPLAPAEAYRIWGSRFFPVVPARPTPSPGRILIPASRIGAVLNHLRSIPGEPAVTGSVSRDGSALLLAFAISEDRLQTLPADAEIALLGIARTVGGDLYHTILKQRAGLSHRR